MWKYLTWKFIGNRKMWQQWHMWRAILFVPGDIKSVMLLLISQIWTTTDRTKMGTTVRHSCYPNNAAIKVCMEPNGIVSQIQYLPTV